MRKNEAVEVRIKREFIHMGTAILWSRRALDPRIKVGAVATTSDMVYPLAIGYNGPAKGLSHDYARNDEMLGSGRSGNLHAEENVIAKVDSRIPDKIVFVTVMPCEHCAQLLVNANFTKVYYYSRYVDKAGLDVFKQCGVEVYELRPSGDPECILLTLDFDIVHIV